MVFRRASRNHSLSEEAKAFNKEARRRVKVFRDKKGQDIEEGDRMIIIGEDEDGKTDDLQKILVNTGDTFSKINGKYNNFIKITILGPFPKQEDEEAEELLTKNDSSVIARFIITSDLLHPEACQFLTGGDAGVDIWEKIWSEYENNLITLQYDILLAPHHCSWHVLSHDSWSDCPDPQVSQEAKAALSQAKDGAFIISSSNPISDKTADPPCVGAKGEYESIVQDKDNFICTCEYPSEKNPEPLEFFISAEGPQRSPKKKGPYITMGGIGATREPLPHG